MAHWLDDDRRIHLNRLETAVAGFDMTMAAFCSAYLNRDVDVPAEVTDDMVRTLEERLTHEHAAQAWRRRT